MTATETITEQRLDIAVRNPADGRVVGSVPDESPAAVAAKIATLRANQPAWEALGPKKRGEWLRKFQNWMIDNSDHIADVLQSETSKPRVDSSIEVPLISDLVNYYVNNGTKFLADEHPMSFTALGAAKKLTKTYRPYPVVGVITPWNFPFAMPGMDVVPALMAGAAVILKPSEVTPLGGAEFVRGWKAIGAPPVLELATGRGETGAAVVENVDYVQFTGSTSTGKIIAMQCAKRLVPYSLELGGKDPALVLSDADIDRAAYGIAFGGLLNAGQVCVSVERVYVEAPVYDEFVAKLTSHVGELRQGADDRKGKFDIGALATAEQRDIVARHVDDAIAKGARATTGGKATGVGTFFEPTVLVDVDHSMSCITEETFGPTIPVIKVADEAEAIRLANDSTFGLSATVWTQDKERGERVARQIEAGAVNINDAASNVFAFALPMGGWKDSGVGARWGGAAGVQKYCRAQAITVPRVPTQKKELIWFPYSPPKVKMALATMRAVSATGLRRFGIGRRS
ncbi:aldehyde dehydrogenase family protein [Antrihabitans cavernicola]|uniref:Aldehyde dehydrogenase n=1 Tax=Antrihabitans cavernicola TaxID=2495913 RepID=A0A5A7SA62_9NOCA|nr:aldehyde dehydrogenase family protein [Spelaeibacter cavernicola]KAA0022072.1 aldehyde dehydrogenase family protein [Spelaeibacter cavernicola]